MEDAYIIGIRLALDNGVSAGVSVIREDLAKLDRATSASTANLRQLQTIAATTISAASGQPQPPRQTEPALPLPNTSPPSVSSSPPDKPVVAPPGQVAPGRTPSPLASELNAPKIRSEALTVAITAPPATAAPQPPLTGAKPSFPEVPIAATSVHDTRPTAPPVLIQAPQTLPPGPVLIAKPTSPTLAVALRRTDDIISPVAAPQFPPPPIPFATSALQNAPRQNLPMSPPRFAAPPSAPLSIAHEYHRTMPPEATTPAAPSRPIASPEPPSLPAAPPASLPSAAPQSPQAQTGPTSGDVFLDGTRLGHWLATTLARQTSRPQSGTTGFDARLSATWPGTQHGGG